MNSEFSRQLRKLSNNGTDSKFMSKFDPLKSRREKRKRNKVTKYCAQSGRGQLKAIEVFDAKGIHVTSGQDLCDCLNPECVGCFFKCPNKKCKSNKCGSDCRQKRKYYYKSIEDQIQETTRLNQIAIDCDPELNQIHIN